MSQRHVSAGAPCAYPIRRHPGQRAVLPIPKSARALRCKNFASYVTVLSPAQLRTQADGL